MPEHLSEKDLSLIRATAREVMKEAGHQCHFNEPTRKAMHAWNDAVVREDADHTTFTVLIQSGNAVRNITKKFITATVVVLVVITVAMVGGFVYGKGSM